MIQQVSVFLENKSGQLEEITRVLADAGVDLRALNIAETTDYGIIRLIADSSEKALKVLEQNGFVGNVTDVVAAALPDKPGGLHELLKILSENGYDIEYMYSVFGEKDNVALLIFKVEQPEECRKLLLEKGIYLVSREELGLK